MNPNLTATIRELAETIRGVTYEKAEASDAPRPGYSPLIRATNIDNGSLALDSFVYVPDVVIKQDQRLREGDIVLAASSGSLSVVGKAALLRTQWHGTFGAFCYAVRPRRERVVPDYLAYFMQTSGYRNRVSRLAAGVNINNLRREHIESVELPYCALAEQRRIVEAIDSYLSRLDAIVVSLQRVRRSGSNMQLGLVSRLRQAILKWAFEGKLVDQDPNDEPADKLLAQLRAEHESFGPTVRRRGRRPRGAG